MTRTLLWVAGGTLLCGAGFMGSRLMAPGPADNAALARQVETLTGQLEELRGSIGKLDRSMGSAGARLGAAVFKPAAQEKRKETIEEEEARVEREQEARAVDERAYYERLEQQLRGSVPAPASRAIVRKNLDALAAAKLQPSPINVGAYECSETLCRLEIQRVGTPSPQALSSAFRHLTRGMREVSMRAFEGDRTVLYAAPGENKLPSMNL